MIGNFPASEADEILLKNPIEQTKPKSAIEQRLSSKGYRLGTKAEDDAKILQTAKALENVKVPSTFCNDKEVEIISEITRQPRERVIPIKIEGREEVHIVDDDEENSELQKAVALSLENYEAEQRNRNCQSMLDGIPLNSKSSGNCIGTLTTVEDDEDDDLKKALQLSLECVTAPQTPDQEDIRCHRLAYLGLHSSAQKADSPTKLNT